jgi:hypothetical protein
MDLGAIFDGAFTVYRSHFWTIVGSIAVMVVPVALMRGLAGEGTTGNPLLVISLVLEVFVSLLTPAIAAIVVGDMALGRAITVGSVWRRMGRVILPLIATMVMVMAAVVGAAALGGFPAVLVYVWFAFAAQVVVLEDTRYGRAMGRSRQLVKHSWWRVFGILLLAQVLVGAATWTLTLAVTGLGGSSVLVSVLTTSAVSLLVAPVAALISALLYFDLRLRHDGTDILAAVENL